MKKLFTLLAFLTCFLGANAKQFVDAEINFSDATEVQLVWGGFVEGAALDIQDGCLHYHSDAAGTNAWDTQFVLSGLGGVSVDVGVTYTIEMKIKGSTDGPFWNIAFASVNKYGIFTVPTDWQVLTFEYEAAGTDNANPLIQCGSYVGDWWIEYIKIYHEGREEAPVDWKNMLTNGDAETPWANPDAVTGDEWDTSICAWSKEYKNRTDNNDEIVHACKIENVDGENVFACHTDEVNPPLAWDSDGEQWGQQHSAGDPMPDNTWQNQFWIALPRALTKEEPYKVKFRYKASEAARVTTQNHGRPGDYIDGGQVGQLNFTTSWQTYESKELSASAGMQSIAFNFGEDKQYEKNIIFYIDDIEVSLMQLKEGFFVGGINANETDFNQYDFSQAIEFTSGIHPVYGIPVLVATVGTVGDESSWVNQIMISTKFGHSKGFKNATIKVNGKIVNDADTWLPYEAAAGTKINLPVAGVWKIMISEEQGMINFIKLEGEPDKEAIEINPNPTVVVVPAGEKPEDGNPWDNQFFITANRPLKAGEVTVIEFDYLCSLAEAKTTTQVHGLPGAYIQAPAIGDVTFTNEEQHFSQTYTVPTEADGMQSFAFNMAEITEACDYTIKNILWKLEDDTESLINQEGGDNFSYNVIGGEAGISTLKANTANNAAIFNLAGQRVGKNFKGIVVKSGKKMIQK